MSEDKFIALASHLAQFAAIFKTKSVFTPMIWFCALIIPCCLGFALWFEDPILKYTLVFMVVGVVVFSCGCYAFFMLKDPKKLQSEEFQIQNQTLDLLEKKGNKIPMDSVNLVKLTQSKSLESNNSTTSTTKKEDALDADKGEDQ